MKIAILTSGILPIPAVQGGAVENLIDFYLNYNVQHHLHDITVYSVWHPNVTHHPAQASKDNHYVYIKVNTLWAKLKKALYKHSHKDGYYHYAIEYYLDQALQKIQGHNFDVIIVENRPGYALKLEEKTTAKLVLHQENDYLNNQTFQYQKIYDAFDLIINTSSYITKRVYTINPHDLKCKTVLNGININYFHETKPFFRQQFRLEEKDFVVVYSGRLTKEKGILQLIQAMKQLQTIPNLRLLIIGASSYGIDKHPTPFIEQLNKESEAIKDRVIYTGFIDYQQVPSILKMSDIAVVPSMWEEPFGLTVIEAMAAGLPLITTRSGGIPEICEGIAKIVERETIVENLAIAILDLYHHPEKRQQMSSASLERSKHFDNETYAKHFFAALEDIYNKPTAFEKPGDDLSLDVEDKSPHLSD